MTAGGEGCICVDGRLLAPREATVSALDAGFLLGDGLFESLRASGGVPYLLDRHLDRLYAGAQVVGFVGMPEPERLSDLVGATLERAGLQEAYLRITVTRGLGGAPWEGVEGAPTVTIAALPALPARPADRSEAVAVALVGVGPRHGPKAKSTSRQEAVVAKAQAQRAGAAEGLYVSPLGNVLEGTASNVFAVCDGRLLTPAVEDCLPGVTRGRLLELAREDGLEALEAPLPVARLLAAEEAFLSNAVRGLLRVRSIDGRPLAGSGKGEVFGRLLGLYEEDRDRVCRDCYGCK